MRIRQCASLLHTPRRVAPGGDSCERLPDLVGQRAKIHLGRRFTRIENYIHWLPQLRQLLAHCCPHAPADAIAHHRAAQRASHRKPDARAGIFRLLLRFHPSQKKYAHIGREMPLAGAIYAIEIGVLQQTRALGKRFGRNFHGWRCGGWSKRLERRLLAEPRLHRDALPPLGAPAGKHRAAALRPHAHAKSVRLGAAAAVGLKCALGHRDSRLSAGKFRCEQTMSIKDAARQRQRDARRTLPLIICEEKKLHQSSALTNSPLAMTIVRAH